ncbi:M16 family metallopeptidase [thiotrophic endosymbiont of Bathymodiolus puteoserpentis (Logatchev)]|uniref:M16 family metallopeptidase n=1 Tax=thiotrophic endosymbiont of Bathymodiolus puteoserpentis (Logatchev) TaxID=343240 RepID=UPI0010B2AC09|nr:pitrilysin family protein [thiotrophic endosymbiont of Bathymodiolus puteoserpentis (Logatchev)]SSC11014.1 FIG015287: Zinc protease [thiotrophic endosymbiont of Bathymodiolus puteoserpentis (Logatchev)]
MKFLVLFLLLVSSVHAKLNIQHWMTPEGAKVLFVQTKGLPILDISLNFDAASGKEGEKYGLASLTNSLLGSATQYRNEEQIINAFESLGAQFSGYSLKDMSIVSLRTLSRESILRKSLNIFTEVVTQPSFKQKYLTRAKRQILQSIRAAQQSPSSIASIAFNKAVFGEHPYAHEAIGTQDTIGNITTKDLKHHYQQFFVAKNLIIALVGDVSKVKAKQIARQISHGLNIGQKAKANPVVKPLNDAQDIHIDFPSKQTHLLIGQTGVNRSHPDFYPLYLGNHIFGGSGLTSILSGEIREKKGLAYSVYSHFSQMQSNGSFVMKLQTKNAQANKAKKIAVQTLNNFINNNIDKQKLQDGKDNIIGGFALQTASNANILTYLSIIGFYNLPLDYLDTFTDKIKDISTQDIQNAFAQLINTDKLVIVSVGQKIKNNGK